MGSSLVVEFRIVDGKGVGVEDLEKPVGTSKNLNNLRFTVAKLVPGTNGSPSQWMSYFIPFPTTNRLRARCRQPDAVGKRQLPLHV